MKICNKCQTAKPIKSFSPNGPGRVRGACKTCEGKRRKSTYNAKPSAPLTALTSKVTQNRLAKEFAKWAASENPFEGTYRIAANGCWNSTVTSSLHGRPMLGATIHYRAVMAHLGYDIEGMHVHHDCRNPWCINPDHLQVLTPEGHLALHKREDSAHLIGPPMPSYGQRKTLACLSAVRGIIEKLGAIPSWSRLVEMTGYSEYLIKKALSQ
jgi:hypothetical protein